MPRKTIPGTPDSCPSSGECYSILEDNDENCHYENLRTSDKVTHTRDHDLDCHTDCRPEVVWVPPSSGK